MGILVAAIVIFIAYRLFCRAVINREEKKDLKIQQQNEREEQAEVDRLLNSDFIRILHEKMISECEESLEWNLNYYLQQHNTRPGDTSRFYYASEWVWGYSMIWASSYDESSKGHIEFKDLGYENMNKLQKEVLGRALAAYSPAWKVDDKREYQNLSFNKEYWDPYIQSYIDHVCDARNIPVLKKI